MSAAGIPMSTHLYPEMAAHLIRVTDTAHWLEWQDWADPILQKPYEIRDGLLHIPDLPGGQAQEKAEMFSFAYGYIRALIQASA